MKSPSRFISVKDAASRLGIAEITAYRWTESGKIPSLKLGGRRLVAEATIEALVASAMGEKVTA